MEKVKLGEIINVITAIQEDKEKGIKAEKSSFQVLLGANLPVKTSYRIKRLGDKLEPILKAYNEKRNELVKEFGELDEKTQNWNVSDPEKLKLFIVKMKELLDTEEDLEFEKVKISELGDDTILPAKDIIGWIFEE